MTVCTWKECQDEATHPQLTRDGRMWANLCDKHHERLVTSKSLDNFNPKSLLSSWVKAQGGAAAAARRM
jgi:hypothetical protein